MGINLSRRSYSRWLGGNRKKKKQQQIYSATYAIKIPCQYNLIPKGSDDQTARHSDHRLNNALHAGAWQSWRMIQKLIQPDNGNINGTSKFTTKIRTKEQEVERNDTLHVAQSWDQFPAKRTGLFSSDLSKGSY